MGGGRQKKKGERKRKRETERAKGGGQREREKQGYCRAEDSWNVLKQNCGIKINK